jgi:hypothetical protein
MPAFCIAHRAASAAIDAVVSPSAAMRRSWMPVRSTIHSCVVSMPRAAKSSLVRTVAGAARPVPATSATGRCPWRGRLGG